MYVDVTCLLVHKTVFNYIIAMKLQALNVGRKLSLKNKTR